jgi:predicted Zn-dependent protease
LDGVGATDQVRLSSQAAARISLGFYNPDTGEVLINSVLDDRAELGVVIAHELGHGMGLSHVADSRVSVMNVGNSTVAPTAADNAAVAAQWNDCQP